MTDEALLFSLQDAMQRNAMEAAGMSVQVGADGEVQASMERLLVQHVRLRGAAGSVCVSRATLSKALVRMALPPLHPAFALLGLRADDVHLEGVELELELAGAAAPAGPRRWRVDPLGALEGELDAHITDAAWVVDADVTLPIVEGRIDFNRVAVEHIGPDSSMGIGRNSIHIDSPNLGRRDLYLFTAPAIPGARYEQRGGFGSRVSDRGSLDLQPFVEALLGGAADEALGKPAGRDVQVMLDRTRLTGGLRLGDGAIGTAQHQLVLAGRASGKNRLSLSSDVLGHRLVLRMPELSASHGSFELLGKRGTTGPVSARLEVHATGLSHRLSGSAADVELAVAIDDMTLRQLALGSVDEPAAQAQSPSVSA